MILSITIETYLPDTAWAEDGKELYEPNQQ